MNEGHIFIDGEINGGMYEYFKQQLAANLSSSKIILHISSPGGSVNLGYNIYHKLKNLSITKECVIEGNCMSIATFIALACDKITALNPSRYMIHLPTMGLEGNRTDLENGAKELEQIEQEMISAYQRKTNLPAEQLKAMLDKETYMSAEQARQYGFVDEVRNELKAVAKGKMANEKKSIFDGFEEQFERVKALFSKHDPKNMSHQTDKGMLEIHTDDGTMEGKPATMGGQPAPDGEYKLEDGKTVTVSGGMVTSVNEGTQPPPPQESAEDKLKKMEAEFNALKAENDQLKAAQAQAAQAQQQLQASEQKVAAMEASAKETREAFAKLKNDFNDLRTKVVGDDAPPKGASAHKKEPIGDNPDNGVIETRSFLEEFAPHLLNLKK